MSIDSSDKIKAVLWILCWSLALSLGMGLTKLLPLHLPNGLVVAIRCWLAFGVLLPVLMRHGSREMITHSHISLNILRGTITCFAMLCTYYAYRNLPLAYASAIGQSGPLFTTVLAIFFLKEQVTWRHWFLILLGYSGVIIMVQPTLHSLDKPTLAALTANILAGMSIIIARTLSSTHSPIALIFYSTSVSAFIMIFIGWSHWQMPTTDQWLVLSAVGVIGVSSQYFYVRALKYAPASFVAPFEYMRLCISIPVGYIMFAEIPSPSTMAGSAVIAVAAILLLRLENQSR